MTGLNGRAGLVRDPQSGQWICDCDDVVGSAQLEPTMNKTTLLHRLFIEHQMCLYNTFVEAAPSIYSMQLGHATGGIDYMAGPQCLSARK